MTPQTGAAPHQWHTIKLIKNPYYRYGAAALIVAYAVWALGSLEVYWDRIVRGLPRAGDMFARMVTPDFRRW